MPSDGRVLLPRDCWKDRCNHTDSYACEAHAGENLDIDWVTEQGFVIVPAATAPARTPSPDTPPTSRP